jgi:hypothetical protein
VSAIRITIGELTVTAELNASPTARKILDSLPLESTANVWGEEIYFDIPVHVDPAPDAVTEVEVGTLAYWPTGPAFCIFFGPTPVSNGQKPRAYSPVNVFGRVVGDTAPLKKVRDGAFIRVEKTDA